MYANTAAWSASEIVFDARGGIVVRTMKNRSSSVMRGSPQLVAKRGPVSDGALAPLSVAPWHDAHDWRYTASPRVAWASVNKPARAAALVGWACCAVRTVPTAVIHAKATTR